jgi:hypothetical protein
MFRVKSTRGRAAAVAAAGAMIVTGFVGLTQSASYAAVSYTSAPTSGVGADASTNIPVVLTGKGFKTASGTALYYTTLLGASGGIQVATSCGTTLATIVGNVTNTASVGVISASASSPTRLALVLKNLPLGAGSVKKDYKICVYSKDVVNSTRALLGSSGFTVYPRPTVTSTVPAGGPTYGGQTVTIEGTNFTNKSTVKFGTVAATGVKFVDATTLTAVAPSGASGNQVVKVTTEAGASTDVVNYAYANTITLSPNTGKAAAGNTITIRGSGFDALTFVGADITVDRAWVVFMPGNLVYTGVDGVDGDVLPDIAPEGYCTNEVVISDTEMQCDTPALTTGLAYNVRVIDDGRINQAVALTTVSSGSTYTAAAF